MRIVDRLVQLDRRLGLDAGAGSPPRARQRFAQLVLGTVAFVCLLFVAAVVADPPVWLLSILGSVVMITFLWAAADEWRRWRRPSAGR